MKEPREIVKELVSQYIKAKPMRISLKLDWNEKQSTISIYGDSLNQTIEHPQSIDFTSFAQGVIEAYREAYGELKVVAVSFREEIYKNEKVALNLYPTGSAGIFDIFIEYGRDKHDKTENAEF